MQCEDGDEDLDSNTSEVGQSSVSPAFADDQFVAKEYRATMERRFRTVSKTSGLVIALGLGWILFGVAVNEPAIVAIASLAIMGSTIAGILIRTDFKLLARLIWFGTGLCTALSATFTLPPASNVELLFAALLGGPFMTFSMRREKPVIIGLLVSILLGWAAFRYLGHDYFGPPILADIAHQGYVSTGVLLTVFGIIVFEMMTFGKLADSYSEDLLRAHQEERKANKAKSEFLAAMSHEIRTPMNGVIGMVEVLENTDLTPAQRRILHTIQESSNSLLWIIDDILDVSKIEAGKLNLVQAPMRLLSVIENATATLRPHAAQLQVQLSLSVQPDLPDTITGDAGRFRQILLNLLGNAIKFSEPLAHEKPGEVSLRVQIREPGWLELIVEDNGIGIEPEVQAAIFAPFERSSVVAKRMIQGNGLGLTIVRQLVTKMGGTIEVDSRLGEGATFTVKLPVVDPSGPFNVPRLAGTRVVALMPQLGQNCAWPSYVLAADCDLKWVADRDELISIARHAGPQDIFVLCVVDHQDQREIWFRQQLAQAAPGVKILELDYEQTGVSSCSCASGRCASVQAAPVLPSEFWEALGRLQQRGRSDRRRQTEAVPARDVPEKRQQGSRILVAEDNDINRAVIENQLALLGCDVTVVRDGAECLEEWKTGAYAVVMTDCQMPVMSGFELTHAIREIEAETGAARTPIIAVTANALEGEAERCRAEGMDGYVSKPVTIAALEQALTEQMFHFPEDAKRRKGKRSAG